jgi:hypothetical protein
MFINMFVAPFFEAGVSGVLFRIGDVLFVDLGPPSHGFRWIITEFITPCMNSAEPSREILTVVLAPLIGVLFTAICAIFIVVVVLVVLDRFHVRAKPNIEHTLFISLLKQLKACGSFIPVSFNSFVGMML